MRSYYLVGLLFVLGCEPGPNPADLHKRPGNLLGNPDELHEHRLKLLNELAEAIESDKPESEIQSLKKRHAEAKQQVIAMAQTLSVEESGRLLEKYGVPLVKADHRYKEALKAAEKRRE